MNLNNLEVRQAIDKKRLKYYQVAEVIGIQPNTLTHWMQTEMNADRKKRVLKAVRSFK